jgi:hypothetical protein
MIEIPLMSGAFVHAYCTDASNFANRFATLLCGFFRLSEFITWLSTYVDRAASDPVNAGIPKRVDAVVADGLRCAQLDGVRHLKASIS